MRAMVARLLLTAFVLTATGCARAPQANQITKLAMVQTICDPHCRSWGATLYPGDGADISDSVPEDDLHTSFANDAFSVLTALLVRTAFFTGKADYRRDPDPEDSTYITAWTETTQRQVAIPSLESPVESNRSLADIRRFALFYTNSVWAARNKARAKTRQRLANLAALAQVEYDANGCYGTCPNYTVRFFRDGHASLESVAPITRERLNARAMVPFATIVQVLRMSEFTDLQKRYPLHAVDVFGARLHLRYRDGFTFDSDAPDSTQWSDQFEQISARIDQVVLETRWTPPLPPR